MLIDMMRTSERGTFKRCQKRWWWARICGLSPKEASKALWFGTGWHLVLADYYKPGKKRSKDYIDVWREWCDTPDADGQYQPVGEMGQEWMDLRKLGEVMLQEYVKEFDGDKTWDVIQTEMMGSVMIPTLDGSDKIQYNFTLDGVYRDTNTKKIMLMEHKTAKQVSVGHLTLDDQAGSYWAIAPTILRKRGILKAREAIRGITYNFAKKQMPETRPLGPDGMVHNKPGKVHYEAAAEEHGIEPPKRKVLAAWEEWAEENDIVVYGDVRANQPKPGFVRHPVIRTQAERRSQIRRIKEEHQQMEAIASGALQPSKNSTKDCSWDCPFFTMCELDEAGGDTAEFAKQVYVVRDVHTPYLDRKVA